MDPIIGITASAAHGEDYSLRRRYCQTILKAGGIPLILPPVGRPCAALGICDGILLSGGGDIVPRLCGICDYDPILLTDPSPERDEYELELASLAYVRRIPILGICRGLQVLNIALGGTLRYHVDGHMQTRSREQPSHSVRIADGTLLQRLVGEPTCEVNSFHHQVAERPSNVLTVSAVAEDGVIEALEASDDRFCLGVQWHPEHMDTRTSQILFAALCAASRKRGSFMHIRA